MDQNIIDHNNLPLPRFGSILLVCGAGLLHSIDELGISHSAANRWLTTTLTICGLISYGNTFIKWVKGKMKQRKIKIK